MFFKLERSLPVSFRSLSRILSSCLFPVIVLSSLSLGAQDTSLILLPKPQLNIGKPLMQVLGDRKSSREFGSKVPDGEKPRNLHCQS
jgi:hypothetical protein